MPTIRTLSVVLCLFLLSGAHAVVPQKSSAFDVRKLSWLAGTWQIKEGETTTEEHWFPFAGSTMLGVSHTFDAKSTRFFEFLRIAVDGDSIAYIAQPKGAPPVSFALKELDDAHAVFENPKHDHPQRIRYEHTDKGLTATISLLDGSKAETFTFTSKSK